MCSIFVAAEDVFFLQKRILLLDCQGSGGSGFGSDLDNFLLHLSIKLASVQIVNVKARITSDDLLTLKVIFR